jgi:DNA-directed RNA polymerase subunit RPC12/RpoP
MSEQKIIRYKDKLYGGSNDGRETEAICPECGGKIIYNGNYFCQHWGTVIEGRRIGGPCDWALPHPVTQQRDKDICDILGIDYG